MIGVLPGSGGGAKWARKRRGIGYVRGGEVAMSQQSEDRYTYVRVYVCICISYIHMCIYIYVSIHISSPYVLYICKYMCVYVDVRI